MVSETSKTLWPNGIGNFKDLHIQRYFFFFFFFESWNFQDFKAQWYWNFQRPYGPVVSKIFLFIQRYWKFKDLKIQWYRKFQRPYGPVVLGISKILWPSGIGNFKDLLIQRYRKFQRP